MNLNYIGQAFEAINSKTAKLCIGSEFSAP